MLSLLTFKLEDIRFLCSKSKPEVQLCALMSLKAKSEKHIQQHFVSKYSSALKVSLNRKESYKKVYLSVKTEGDKVKS